MQASEEVESLLCCRWQNIMGMLQHAYMRTSDGSLSQHAKSAATCWLLLTWACSPSHGISGIGCPWMWERKYVSNCLPSALDLDDAKCCILTLN